jgi:hypothetical protein
MKPRILAFLQILCFALFAGFILSGLISSYIVFKLITPSFKGLNITNKLNAVVKNRPLLRVRARNKKQQYAPPAAKGYPTLARA